MNDLHQFQLMLWGMRQSRFDRRRCAPAAAAADEEGLVDASLRGNACMSAFTQCLAHLQLDSPKSQVRKVQWKGQEGSRLIALQAY